MFVTEETLREVNVLDIFNQCQPITPQGQRERERWKPFVPGEESRWQAELSRAEQLMQVLKTDPAWEKKLLSTLPSIPDCEVIFSKLESGQSLTFTEWFVQKKFLFHALSFLDLAREKHLEWAAVSPKEQEQLAQLLSMLNPVPPLSLTFSLERGFDETLARFYKRLRTLEREIESIREQQAKAIEERYGIRRNAFGQWVVSRQSRLADAFLQEPKVKKERETPYEVIFVPVDSQEIQNRQIEITELQKKIEAREQDVFARLHKQFAPHSSLLHKLSRQIGSFDLLFAKVRAAKTWSGVKPAYCPDRLRIAGGFHPLVRKEVEARKRAYVPVEIEIEKGATVIVGPNMGGKTVVLKTIGTIVILAQYGFLVPAGQCEMPLFPFVESILSDAENIRSGLSRFGAEMMRLANVFAREEGGLLLLDEIGRGTNPREGAAISRALTKYLAESRFWTVHVTHYPQVLDVEKIRIYQVAGITRLDLDRLKHWDELERWMDYRLIPVRQVEQFPRQAISIAKALGIPDEIVKEAKRICGEEERNGSETSS